MKVYFSQADSRWANKIYSIKNDKTQTMKSSGCGPTSASMIVFNLTNNRVYPDEMADLYVKNKFRTSNNGTDASAFKWTAEKYNLNYQLSYKIDEAVNCLKNNGMVIARVGNGLFTTSGHYIVLADYGTDGYILVYDPYVYKNKFTINGRSGKVIQDGNYVYVTKQNLKSYGNVKEYYLFNKKEERKLNKQECIEKLKTILSDDTIKYLDMYRYGDDLIIKLGNAMK